MSWDRSVRGRLHFLREQDAARTLRERDRTLSRDRRFTRGEAIVVALFAGLQTLLMLATLLVALTNG